MLFLYKYCCTETTECILLVRASNSFLVFRTVRLKFVEVRQIFLFWLLSRTVLLRITFPSIQNS